MELASSPPLVQADRQCLEQILQNLLTNASKSTPEGGHIEVTAWQDNDSMVVRVSDTGIGIPAEKQERIFQPYYQVDRSGKPRGRGLAITKLLVELQGESIQPLDWRIHPHQLVRSSGCTDRLAKNQR